MLFTLISVCGDPRLGCGPAGALAYLFLSAGSEGTALCSGSNSSSCWMMDLALTWTPEILMLIPRRFPGPFAKGTEDGEFLYLDYYNHIKIAYLAGWNRT